MEPKNTKYEKGKKFPSLSSMGNPYRHFHKMNIDNSIYNKEVLKKIRQAVIRGVGGVLIVGGVTLAFASGFPGESIKVPKGSTLSQISVEHGISQEELLKRNRKIKNPNYIQEGQDLTLYDEGAVGLCQTAWDILDKYVF